MPINDSHFSIGDPLVTDSKGSGTHWSMLLYARKEKQFLYFDSLGTYNLKAAEAVAAKLLLRIGMTEQVKIKLCTITKQNNSYDCGLHMLLVAEMLLAHIADTGSVDTDFEIPRLYEIDVWTKRAQLASILHNTRSSSNIKCLAPIILSSAKTKLKNKLNDKIVHSEPQNNEMNRVTQKSQACQVKQKNNGNWTQVKSGKSVKTNTKLNEYPITLTNKYECLRNEDQEEIDTQEVEPEHCRGNIKQSKYYWENHTFTYKKDKQKEVNALVLGDSMLKHVSVPDTELKFYRGATAEQMCQRLKNVSTFAKNPKTVVLHFGSNDLDCLGNSEDVMGAMCGHVKNLKQSIWMLGSTLMTPAFQEMEST
ncbi:SUMO1 sentrin specific peptidase 8 [Homalodisca vitripennis]|nr:SUMO1 sentrin specific peptidase 8 [Homalodisca vitripennis]